MEDTSDYIMVMGLQKMNFSEALTRLKMGRSLKRENWNGKNMVIFTLDTESVEKFIVIERREGDKPYIRNSWVPSVADLFAEDWVEVK